MMQQAPWFRLNVLVPILAAVSHGAFAADTASVPAPKPACVVAVAQANPTSVGLRQRADFVAMPITFVSEQKDPDLRAEELRQARETLRRKAQDNPRIRVRTGPATLSARPVQKFESLKLDSPLISGAETASQASFYVLAVLDRNKGDLYTCSAEARRFLSELKLPGRTQCNAGEPALAVDNPEQYRPHLLQAVAQELGRARDALGDKAVFTLEGLHGPVLVRPIDDADVELFLAYALQAKIGE
jgi:hypothetical protein